MQAGAEATVWLLDASGLDEQACLHRLGESELRRYRAFGRPARRFQFLAGRMLLRLAARELAGVPPGALGVTERHGQAPLLRIAGGATPPHCSLSHTSRWVACAASMSTPLGVDIETLDASRDLAALAGHAFGTDEAAHLAALPPEQLPAAFYAQWSRREAEFKLGQLPACHYALPVGAHGLPLSAALCTAQPLAAAPALIVLGHAVLLSVL